MMLHKKGVGMLLHKGRMLTRISMIPAIASAMMTAPQMAHAQEEASDKIDDIVVTARKRSESQRDVPVAISAVTGGQLVANNIAVLRDLVVSTPALTLNYGSISPFTLVRGFGSGASTSFDQAVGKFIDNISFGRDQDARIPLFDVERVEVLKGPQVLVFGNSSTAGAINVATKRPGQNFEATGSVAYEFNNNEVLTQGGVTTPVSDAVSLRLAGFYQRLAKGWIKNAAFGGSAAPTIKNFAFRPTLRIEPSPDLRIYLKAEYDRIREDGGALQPYIASTNPLVKFTEVNLDDHRNVSNAGAPFFNSDDFVHLTSYVYQGDINWDILGGTLTSTTAYRHSKINNYLDADMLPVAIFGGSSRQRYKQFSQEIRFNGNVGKLDYVLGGYYEHDKLEVLATQNFNLAPAGIPLPPFSRVLTFDNETGAYSAFVDATYHFTDRLSLEAGVRWTKTDKNGVQSSNPGNIIPHAERADRAATGLSL